MLAYSTIAQYGYVVAMLGVGGPTSAVGGALYVIAHALAKSAFFLTAGAVTEATGEDRLSRVGGLGRSMPVLAVASGTAAATLAGLPLTIGFSRMSCSSRPPSLVAHRSPPLRSPARRSP